MRQRRLHNFGLALAGESAWDILLALYRGLLAGQDLTFQQLCTETGAYPATIRRWLAVLTGLGLIAQPDGPADPAQQQARLTPRGEQAMADCLRGLLADTALEQSDHRPA